MGITLQNFNAEAEAAEAESRLPQLPPGNYLAAVTKVTEQRSEEAKKGNEFPAIGLSIGLLVCRNPEAVLGRQWDKEAGSIEVKRYSWVGYYDPAAPGQMIPPHQRNQDGTPLRPSVFRDLAALGWTDDVIDYAALQGRLVIVNISSRKGTGEYADREFVDVKYMRPFFSDPNDPTTIAPLLADVASEQFGPEAGPAF